MLWIGDLKFECTQARLTALAATISRGQVFNDTEFTAMLETFPVSILLIVAVAIMAGVYGERWSAKLARRSWRIRRDKVARKPWQFRRNWNSRVIVPIRD